MLVSYGGFRHLSSNLRQAAQMFEQSYYMHATEYGIGKLDAALNAVAYAKSSAYIEVVTDAYAASPLALNLRESL